MVTELQPIYSSRKSFYGKASVETSEDGSKTLLSYNTRVCRIVGSKVYIINVPYVFSKTTLSHIKEFLLQNGFKAESKKQICNDYEIVD